MESNNFVFATFNAMPMWMSDDEFIRNMRMPQTVIPSPPSLPPAPSDYNTQRIGNAHKGSFYRYYIQNMKQTQPNQIRLPFLNILQLPVRPLCIVFV